jgi:hypothetical protein
LDIFLVKCKKHKASSRQWILESGRVYEARKSDRETMEVTNHYGDTIELTLREFHLHCEIIKKII